MKTKEQLMAQFDAILEAKMKESDDCEKCGDEKCSCEKDEDDNDDDDEESDSVDEGNGLSIPQLKQLLKRLEKGSLAPSAIKEIEDTAYQLEPKAKKYAKELALHLNMAERHMNALNKEL